MKSYIHTYQEFINEDSNFSPTNSNEIIKKLEENITKVPVIKVHSSDLGGKTNISILITLGFDEKEKWPNKIFENSRYAKFHYSSDGKLELFQQDYHIKTKFRKATCKNVDDAIAKINKFISDVQAS